MLGISKSKESILMNFQFRIYLINLYIFETILPPGSGSATLNFLQPLTFSEAKDDIIFIDKASSTTVKQRKKKTGIGTGNNFNSFIQSFNYWETVFYF